MRIRDDSGEQPFFAGHIECIKATDKAIQVKSLRGKGQPTWVPQSCIHDDSDVWKQGQSGKLFVKQWFASKQGWGDGETRQQELSLSQSKCRKCSAPIVWVKTEAGKNTPQDLDGTSHWASCRFADDFRKPKEARP